MPQPLDLHPDHLHELIPADPAARYRRCYTCPEIVDVEP
jgi:hypothetical protein